MARHAERNRTKISATLAPELIERVAQYQSESGLASFSAALEELLWRQLMEERARAYYLNMTEEERTEQRRWVKFATEQAAKTLGRD
jgi:hypothetical protein